MLYFTYKCIFSSCSKWFWLYKHENNVCYWRLEANEKRMAKGEKCRPHFPSTWGSPNINYPITCQPIKAFPRVITQSGMITERLGNDSQLVLLDARSKTEGWTKARSVFLCVIWCSGLGTREYFLFWELVCMCLSWVRGHLVWLVSISKINRLVFHT